MPNSGQSMPALSKAKILVTGGAGSIGSLLVDELSRANTVTVLDNLSTGSLSNLSVSKDRITFIKGDILDRALLNDMVEANEYVFHLAANIGYAKSMEDPFLDMELNAKGTLGLLEACRQHHVKRLVFSSSAAVYGQAKYLPINEDHPLNPESPYAVSKMAAEKYCFAFYKMYGLPAVSLRYFNVYGPRLKSSGYATVIPIFMRKVREGQPLTIFGDGEQSRDFVYVGDIVAANILAATNPDAVGGVFNVATGKGSSLNELIGVLDDLSGKKNEVIHAVARAGEIKHSRASLYKSRKVLRYKPAVTFKEGLALTWRAGEGQS